MGASGGSGLLLPPTNSHKKLEIAGIEVRRVYKDEI